MRLKYHILNSVVSSIITNGYINMKQKHNKNNQQGFTLVELSIVLVIIGLIVGGVLVGQDMIKAAEIRSTIAQLEQYNTATNTFRDKYRYIPGDITSTYATQFGFGARAGGVGAGDGNRILEGCSTGATVFGCETALFWPDLSDANLLSGAYSGADTLANACANPGACEGYVPVTKLGKGNMITVFSAAGQNYYEIHGVASITTATGVYALTNSMSPQEAYNIDEKLDDGNPMRGTVRAVVSAVALNATAVPANQASGVCVADDITTPASDTYNTANEDWASTPSCGLRFKMQ